jgi:hypothetical protein
MAMSRSVHKVVGVALPALVVGWLLTSRSTVLPHEFNHPPALIRAVRAWGLCGSITSEPVVDRGSPVDHCPAPPLS